jgi:hypothetical protein
MAEQVFVLTVVAQPGVDPVLSLRRLLKAMLRSYGLRCIRIHVEEAS